MTERTCTIDGCDNARASRWRCSEHYATPVSDRKCTVDGCGKGHSGRGYCRMHYKRWLTHGDPLVVARGGNKGQQRSETNPNWKGSDVSYSGAHMRIRAERGRSADYTCECGKPASHWAYDHADPNALYARDGRPYSADPSHYRPMCVSCHKHADLTVLGGR